MANDRYIGYGTFKGLLGKSTENFGEENSYTTIKDEFGNSYESKSFAYDSNLETEDVENVTSSEDNYDEDMKSINDYITQPLSELQKLKDFHKTPIITKNSIKNIYFFDGASKDTVNGSNAYLNDSILDLDIEKGVVYIKSPTIVLDGEKRDSKKLKIGTYEIENGSKQVTINFNNVYASLKRNTKLPESTPQQSEVNTVEQSNNPAEQIYSQLGDKTQSENVVIKHWNELKDTTKAITDNGNVISTRIKNTNEHFGNPFSHDPVGKAQGLIKTETVKEAVEKYIEWLTTDKYDFDHPLKTMEDTEFNSFHQQIMKMSGSTNKNTQEQFSLNLLLDLLNRKKWIRKQIESGELKGKPILYYKELGEPSHATALDYLINKYDWNKQQPNTVEQNVKGIEINSYQIGLGNDLTNVHYANKEYPKSKYLIVPTNKDLKLTQAAKTKWGESVEAWYKSNNAQTKGIPEGEQGDKYDFDLMVGLITDKLNQYPNLIQQINEKGGLVFLQKSTHTMGTGRWSSKNPKNMFMNSLIQAYKNVVKQSETKDTQITKEDTDKLPPCTGE